MKYRRPERPNPQYIYKGFLVDKRKDGTVLVYDITGKPLRRGSEKIGYLPFASLTQAQQTIDALIANKYRQNPVKIRKLPDSNLYQVRHDGRVSARAVPKRVAEAQKRLLLGIEHGMVPRKNVEVNVIIADAIKRYEHEGERGLDWEWFHVMSAADRNEFEKYLVSIKHPLAYEPGSKEFRFKQYIREQSGGKPVRFMTQGNPPETLIYDEALEITARKGQGHRCDPACKRANHVYRHKFTHKHGVYGTSDGKKITIH